MKIKYSTKSALVSGLAILYVITALLITNTRHHDEVILASIDSYPTISSAQPAFVDVRKSGKNKRKNEVDCEPFPQCVIIF